MLLVIDDEESVFWVLQALVSKLLPDYYSPSMTAVRVDINVFGLLVKVNAFKIFFCHDLVSQPFVLFRNECPNFMHI